MNQDIKVNRSEENEEIRNTNDNKTRTKKPVQENLETLMPVISLVCDLNT